jgi:hypothetical protein
MDTKSPVNDSIVEVKCPSVSSRADHETAIQVHTLVTEVPRRVVWRIPSEIWAHILWYPYCMWISSHVLEMRESGRHSLVKASHVNYMLRDIALQYLATVMFVGEGLYPNISQYVVGGSSTNNNCTKVRCISCILGSTAMKTIIVYRI